MSTVEAVASHRASRERPPSVEIVVPVYNEEAELEASILRLRWFLDTSFPFDATVTVADNASTDRTWEIAADLARRVPGVRAVHLAEKGRGRALRATWMASDATVVAYMDVDLATGLDALLPLVAPLLSGHSDVAIGTRLARGSRVVRGPKRELISRGYNLVVRAALHNGFSDAQCGFKAVRTDVARALLPMVEDETWFFDTELLVLAERHALRIHEVPVDWTDDPDSRVDIRQTAVDDLRGVWRLMRSRPARDPRSGGSAPAVGGRLDPGGSPLARFAGVGLASTVAYLVLYLLLRAPLGDLRGERGRPRPLHGGEHGRPSTADLRRRRPARPHRGPRRGRRAADQPGVHHRRPGGRRLVGAGVPGRPGGRAARRHRSGRAGAVRPAAGLGLPGPRPPPVGYGAPRAVMTSSTVVSVATSAIDVPSTAAA